MPQRHQALLSGKRVQVRIPLRARRRVKPLEQHGSAEWQRKFRVMPKSGAKPGPWRDEFTPHLPQILDEYDKPWVREMYYCGPERDGKTNGMLSALGRGQTCAPGNFFYMMSNEKKSQQIFELMIKPMFSICSPLRKLLTGRANDFRIDDVKLNNGIIGFACHASSAASLASFPAKYLFADEVDKNDEVTGTETSSIELLRKRMRELEDGKLFAASTPAGKFIYKLVYSSVQVFRFEMQCPHCHDWFIAGEEGLHIPDGATVESLKSGEHVAMQHCQVEGCGAELSHDEFRVARKNARKVIVNGDDVKRPESVGVHRSAWDCHLIPLKEIAIAKVKADTGGLAAKRDYAHGYKCEDHKTENISREETNILILCDDRPEGVLPDVDIAALLLTVDTQMNHFWYVLRAFAFGMEQESWQVRCGQLQTFAAIEQMMYEMEFKNAAGLAHRINAVAIDTGGTKHEGDDHSRTYEVYNWAIQHPIVYPFKGAKRQAAPYRASNQQFFPGTNKAIPGGLKLYNVNANFYKDELDRRLSVNPTDPGAFHLHSGFAAPHLELPIEQRPPSLLNEYARHMCGEHRDDSGQWDKRGGRRHDYWDCEYMQIALTDILGVKFWVKPEEQQLSQPKRRVISKGVKRD